MYKNDTMKKEPITPYLKSTALLILSGCFCLILIQESGAFYQQIKAGQPGFPSWGGFAVAALLELGAISVAAWCPVSAPSQFFRLGLLTFIFVLTVGGATIYNIAPIHEQANQLSDAEKRKLEAMEKTKAAAEQLRKDKDAESASLKSDMKTKKSELKADKSKLSEMILSQSKKIEIATLKIAEEKQFKFEFSMINFQFFVQVFLRVIFQILAWFLASLALTTSDNFRQLQTTKKEVFEALTTSDNTLTTSDNAYKNNELSIVCENTDNTGQREQTTSDNTGQHDNFGLEHRAILEFIQREERVMWRSIIQSKRFRIIGATKIESLINDLEKKGFVVWEKPNGKKAEWLVTIKKETVL